MWLKRTESINCPCWLISVRLKGCKKDKHIDKEKKSSSLMFSLLQIISVSVFRCKYFVSSAYDVYWIFVKAVSETWIYKSFVDVCFQLVAFSQMGSGTTGADPGWFLRGFDLSNYRSYCVFGKRGLSKPVDQSFPWEWSFESKRGTNLLVKGGVDLSPSPLPLNSLWIRPWATT